MREKLVIVRGGGDIATGTIYKLWRCGYPVLVLETGSPSAIRRYVALSEAVYDGESRVEDLWCKMAENLEAAWKILRQGGVPMIVDPECRILEQVRPYVLVDGILAKKNLGTSRQMADKTIALGPGFTAGVDVDLVIETMRGHKLGRVITSGCAIANTGIPGMIGGYGKERVIHAPGAGIIRNIRKITDLVREGQQIASITTKEGVEVPVCASMNGLLRGLIRDGYLVTKGFKIADIDPRESEYENCFTISDKARCIAGGVLEGILYLERRGKETGQ